MDIKERQQVQDKGEIIGENFPNLKKEMPIKIQEASRYQTDMSKIEPPQGILYVKQLAQRTRKEY
jgi:hypothetical protein